MGSLSVPTVEVDAQLLWADGTVLSGLIFLAAGTPHHAGPQRPADWAEDPQQFFAFRPEKAATALLLNKQTLVSITVGGESDHDDSADFALVQYVVVTVGQQELRGRLLIEMPEGHERVLDLLNGSQAFVTLVDGDQHHLIRKSAITQVEESRRDKA